MNEKLKKIYARFIKEFGYAPEFPREIGFDQDKYGEILLGCVNDKNDYTIEMYGTKPPRNTGHSSVLVD